jgi:hypothetical protein
MSKRDEDRCDGESQPRVGEEHPSSSEWMEWLYGESNRKDHQRLQAHLNRCSDCRGQVQRWQAVMQQLNAGALPKSQPAWSIALPTLKWAAAAALVLGLGFTLGRWSNHSSSQFAAWEQKLQAQWRQDMRLKGEQLRADWETAQKTAGTALASQIAADSQKLTESYWRQFSREYAVTRQNDLAWLVNHVQTLENQRNNENSLLRKDLETLAVTAEGELMKTRRQIGNLMLLTGYPSTPTAAPNPAP